MCVLCCYSPTKGRSDLSCFFCYPSSWYEATAQPLEAGLGALQAAASRVDFLSRKNEVGDKLLKCCFIFETKGFALFLYRMDLYIMIQNGALGL